jgi:hypothetical protein
MSDHKLWQGRGFAILNAVDAPRFENAPDFTVSAPRVGTEVRNIHSGLKGRIAWTEGEVFRLDSGLKHYRWNDSWATC